MNQDLLLVNEWANNNEISTNAQNSFRINIYKRALYILTLDTLIINGQPIQFCKKLRNL